MRKLTPKQATRYFRSRKVKLTFKIGDIQFYEDKRLGHYAATRTIWIDNRTQWKSIPNLKKSTRGLYYAIVYPFGLSDNRVYIVCPYCGWLHSHSNFKGNYKGFRTPHCPQPNYNHDYYIEAL